MHQPTIKIAEAIRMWREKRASLRTMNSSFLIDWNKQSIGHTYTEGVTIWTEARGDIRLIEIKRNGVNPS